MCIIFSSTFFPILFTTLLYQRLKRAGYGLNLWPNFFPQTLRSNYLFHRSRIVTIKVKYLTVAIRIIPVQTGYFVSLLWMQKPISTSRLFKKFYPAIFLTKKKKKEQSSYREKNRSNFRQISVNVKHVGNTAILIVPINFAKRIGVVSRLFTID